MISETCLCTLLFFIIVLDKKSYCFFLFVFFSYVFFSIENMSREKRNTESDICLYEPSNNIMSIIRLIRMLIFSPLKVELIESKSTNTYHLDNKSIEKKTKIIGFFFSITQKSTNAIECVSQLICCYLILYFRQVILKKIGCQSRDFPFSFLVFL